VGWGSQRLKIDIAGTTATVEKEMTTVPVRMIGKLPSKYIYRIHLSDEHKQRLDKAAQPVRYTKACIQT